MKKDTSLRNKGAGPSFKEGDLVFAKVKGYPPWPARVSQPVDEKGLKYHVFFYGTYETAVVPKDRIWIYNQDTKKKYGKMKRKGFAEAIIQIERSPNIALPQDLQEPEYADDTFEESLEDVTENLSDEEAPPKMDKDSRNRASAPSAGKTAKTKSEELGTPTTGNPEQVAPQSKKVKLDNLATPDNSAPTGRSGRVIKPKFADDFPPSKTENSPTTSDANQNSNKMQDLRKSWVHVNVRGEMIKIDLDKDRPVQLKSKDAKVQWETVTANNALNFKESVETGQIIPEEVRKKLEEKSNSTPQEEEILLKKMQCRKESLEGGGFVLEMEQRLIDLDMALKTATHYENPNMPECLELLDKLYQIPLTPLILKKQPDIVRTIRKLRKYIGPQREPSDPKILDQWISVSKKIRIDADAIFNKIKRVFTISEGDDSFWDLFETAVTEFEEETTGLESNQALHMVTDSTLKKNLT